ncbi:hypothetical protein ZWY2020_053111 [Hordeum vulgare]|nr:hypothetical protein ZWY2020_053111 [Hordeum vulgare]
MATWSSLSAQFSRMMVRRPALSLRLPRPLLLLPLFPRRRSATSLVSRRIAGPIFLRPAFLFVEFGCKSVALDSTNKTNK